MGMKFFKKRRTKLPKLGAIPRLIRRTRDPALINTYNAIVNRCTIFPQIMREVCLAHMDPNKRANILYTPDMKNFAMHLGCNRSLPADKFLSLFKGMIDQDTLDKLLHDLSNFRLEIYTEPDDWMRVYADENVHSCMSGRPEVKCYAHPENDLALAALYAPGTNTVVARTIVNTKDKWYVRLFGDRLLVDKLADMGYRRMDGMPPRFRMYGMIPGTSDRFDRSEVILPYLDFDTQRIDVLDETRNMETRLVDVLVGFTDHQLSL